MMETSKFPTYFLQEDNRGSFLQALAYRFSLYVPQKSGEVIHYRPFSEDSIADIVSGEIRATEPLKAFLFPAIERVAAYFHSYSITIRSKPMAMLGVKSCDLHSLKLLDKIFIEGDFQDPTYSERRKDDLIIASDCTSCGESCFCVLMGVDPYPGDYFDLGFSEVLGGVLVSVGSEKGNEIIKENKDLFRDAQPKEITEREEKRKSIKELVEKKTSEYKIDVPYEELLRKKLESPVWNETTKTCVECGACTQVCPTCYCFLLADELSEDGFDRRRTWDTCQFKGFARVAGGGNAREHLAERLRHRYLHKFDYLKESYDFYACTGCGRCIQACMGKIDMRNVFIELSGAATHADT